MCVYVWIGRLGSRRRFWCVCVCLCVCVYVWRGGLELWKRGVCWGKGVRGGLIKSSQGEIIEIS